MKKIQIIQKKDIGFRLDKWLKNNYSSLKQSFIEKNIRKKNILVNNLKKNANYRLKLKDEILLLNYSKEKYKHEILTKDYNIPNKVKDRFKDSIIFENINFIILNKWSGIASQGGSKIAISIDHIIKNISPKYNLVHRLDKETSGLLIIAKNLEYTKIFGSMFKNKEIHKTYIAICQGKPKILESVAHIEITSKEKKNVKHQTETYYKVIKINNNLSQIIYIPKTGKTHQLRIVSKKLGCPIIGDKKYNLLNKYQGEELKLNAFKISFTIKEKVYNFSSLLPDHFTKFIKKNQLKSF